MEQAEEWSLGTRLILDCCALSCRSVHPALFVRVQETDLLSAAATPVPLEEL